MFLGEENGKRDISFELKDTLDFIAGKEPQSEYAKDLQKAVEEVKPEWNGDRIYDIIDER